MWNITKLLETYIYIYENMTTTCHIRCAAFSPLANGPPAISPAANGSPAKSPPPAAIRPPPPAIRPPLAYVGVGVGVGA